MDARLARKVSRSKIGTLKGRLFFTPDGGTQDEVTIHRFVDQGVTSESWAVGTEQVGHRYAIQVNREWWDANGALNGIYQVQISDDLEELIPVLPENQVVDDSNTYVDMTFKVVSQIESSEVIDL